MRSLRLFGLLAVFGVVVGACEAMKQESAQEEVERNLAVSSEDEKIRAGLRALAQNINAKVIYNNQELTGVDGIKTLLGNPERLKDLPAGGVWRYLQAKDEANRRLSLYKEGDGYKTAYMSAAAHLNKQALVIFLTYLNETESSREKTLALSIAALNAHSANDEHKDILIMLMMAGADWTRLLTSNAYDKIKENIKQALSIFCSYFDMQIDVAKFNVNDETEHNKERIDSIKNALFRLEVIFNKLSEEERLSWSIKKIKPDSDEYREINGCIFNQEHIGYSSPWLIQYTKHTKTEKGCNDLINAAWKGDLAKVKDLIKPNGVGVNCLGINSIRPTYKRTVLRPIILMPRLETALYNAAYAGHLDIVNFLLENGADVNAAVQLRGERDNPLFAAVREGHETVVERLLKNSRIDYDLIKGPGGHDDALMIVSGKRYQIQEKLSSDKSNQSLKKNLEKYNRILTLLQNAIGKKNEEEKKVEEKKSEEPASAEWACSACTYLNQPKANVCEMCGTKKQ